MSVIPQQAREAMVSYVSDPDSCPLDILGAVVALLKTVGSMEEKRIGEAVTRAVQSEIMAMHGGIGKVNGHC